MTSAAKAIKEIAKALISIFGEQILVLVKDKLKSKFSKFFKNKNILILGDQQTGKTSLIYLLEKGTPYELGEDGEIITADRTIFTAIIDKKINLKEGNWAKVKQDVPGDINMRETWKEAIDIIKPHGIIYMIDGRLEENQLKIRVKDFYESVVTEFKESLGNLKTIYLLINFSDQWAKSKLDARKKVRFIEAEVDIILSDHPIFQGVIVEAHHTHLSPHADKWTEATSAVVKFGIDLTS